MIHVRMDCRAVTDNGDFLDPALQQTKVNIVSSNYYGTGRFRVDSGLPLHKGWQEVFYLRVILLPDGETVLNAFFDRRFTLTARTPGQ